MKKVLFLGIILVILLFFGYANTANAEYEIETSLITSNVPKDGVTVVQWTEDVTVEWEQPAMSGGDGLNGFVYKWNTSSTSLPDLTVNNADGTVANTVDPPYVTKAKSFFATDDSNVIRYLHIRTWFYDDSAKAVTYSDDVVIGGINIDNVAPTGTVSIVDSGGSDITSAYNSSLNLKFSAAVAPVKVYINETGTLSTAKTSDDTSAAVYTLNDSTTGTKTIYVWFEDAAGNISSMPATDTVTLLPTGGVSPYEGIFDISLGTQQFMVDGSTELYDWAIINETPDISGNDVADFSGAYQNTTDVTVSLLYPGTFKLQANPSDGGTTITSGTITVQVSCYPGDVNNDGSVNAADLYLAVDFIFGTIPDAQEFCAANVDDSNDQIDITDLLEIIDLMLGY